MRALRRASPANICDCAWCRCCHFGCYIMRPFRHSSLEGPPPLLGPRGNILGFPVPPRPQRQRSLSPTLSNLDQITDMIARNHSEDPSLPMMRARQLQLLKTNSFVCLKLITNCMHMHTPPCLHGLIETLA